MRFGDVPTLGDARYSFKDFFTYTVSLPSGSSLAPAASTTLTYNIDGESDFFWDKATVFASIAGAATNYFENELPDVLITIVDTNSQRPLQNVPTPVPNLFGTGLIPFILPIQKVFLSKATVKLSLQNVGDATYTRLDFSFVGIKAYLRGN
jgi:hypothetical protein